MIQSIAISHFRCFDHLKIDKVARINVVVGDNGSGKTALMEAVFLALNTGTDLVNRFRLIRGLDAVNLTGTFSDLENTMMADLFYNYDTSTPVSISLKATGVDNRAVQITRGFSTSALRYFKRINPGCAWPSANPFVFSWKDKDANERFAVPHVLPQGFQWPTTGESLPDFYYFGATTNTPQ